METPTGQPSVYWLGSKVFIRWTDQKGPMWTTVTRRLGTDQDDLMGWTLRLPVGAVRMAPVERGPARRDERREAQP